MNAVLELRKFKFFSFEIFYQQEDTNVQNKNRKKEKSTVDKKEEVKEGSRPGTPGSTKVVDENEEQKTKA